SVEARRRVLHDERDDQHPVLLLRPHGSARAGRDDRPMSDRAELPIVAAITGASGAPYAVRLLETLLAADREIWLIVSSHGLRLLRTEMDIDSVDALRQRVGVSEWRRLVT